MPPSVLRSNSHSYCAAPSTSGISPFAQCRTSSPASVESVEMVPTASFGDAPINFPHVHFREDISSVDVVKRVDKVLGEFCLQVEDLNEVVEIMNTCRWVSIDGSNFMRYRDEGEDKTFYVRPCYRDIYQILHDTWQGQKPRYEEPQHCCLINGTPGIGKSVFGKILCVVISQQPKPSLIFYQGGQDSSPILFWQGSSYAVETERQFRQVINRLLQVGVYSTSHDDDRIEIWSIGDTNLPLENWHIKRVCITSPCQSGADLFSAKLKQWVKNNYALTLTIPPCTWDEILHIRLACFGALAEKNYPVTSLRQRFDLWGGVPRTLMYNQCLDASHVNAEVNKWKVMDAIRCLGYYDFDHSHHSGKMFHLYPCFKSLTKEEIDKLTLVDRYNGNRAKYYWASEVLERKAWRHFRRHQEAEVIEYILNLNNDPAAREKPWEEHIHQLMETSGLEGTLRNIETEEEQKLLLQPRFASFFDDFDDIDDSKQYWRATSRKYPACDGYVPDQGIMLQITISNEHSINTKGLERAMTSGIFREWENEHPEEQLKLIFVVESGAYSEYERKQAFISLRSGKSANSKGDENIKDEGKLQMKQYVLKIDSSARLRELRYGTGYKRLREEDEDKELTLHQKQKKIIW